MTSIQAQAVENYKSKIPNEREAALNLMYQEAQKLGLKPKQIANN
jgi:uncharacterized protein YbjQ (UPF0145 family)